jgi:hypothetical protein
LAPRILDGALGDVLARERVATEAAALAHHTTDDDSAALPPEHDD